tara:strand:+ start:947 stop:1087 length:141 start_codon:yes stop_codon:yes gene_type:complete
MREWTVKENRFLPFSSELYSRTQKKAGLLSKQPARISQSDSIKIAF